MNWFKAFCKLIFCKEERNIERSNVISQEQIRAIELTAYHESGHTVFAYLVGWSVDQITMKFRSDHTIDFGTTLYNFGADQRYISIIVQNLGKEFDSLSTEEKIECVEAGRRRIIAILGGPIAEFVFDKVNLSNTSVFTDLNHGDASLLKKIDRFLKRVDNEYGQAFALNAYKKFSQLYIIEPVFDRAVSQLAKALLEKGTIGEKEIANVIDDSGFSIYMEKFE